MSPEEGVETGADLTATERARLARAIHDEVMQGLAACMLSAELGARFCKSERIDDVLTELDTIREGLDLAVTSLRGILGELRLPA